MNGNIYIKRDILEWRWFKYPKTAHLFFYLLIRANYKDSFCGEILIRRSQLLTSRSRLCTDTGLTESEVKTSLNRLKKSGDINVKSGRNHTLITVLKYDEYQGVMPNCDQQMSNGRPTDNQRMSPYNKNNKKKKGEISCTREADVAISEAESSTSGDVTTIEYEKLEKQIIELHHNKSWKEVVCMNFHAKETEVDDYLDEFFEQCKLRNWGGDSLQSLFTSWLGSEINNKKKNSKYGNNRQSNNVSKDGRTEQQRLQDTADTVRELLNSPSIFIP